MELFLLGMWWQFNVVLGQLLSCECEVTQEGREVDGHLLRNKRGMPDPPEKRLGCHHNFLRWDGVAICTSLREMGMTPPPSEQKCKWQHHPLKRTGYATSIILGGMGMPPALSLEMWDATSNLVTMGISFAAPRDVACHLHTLQWDEDATPTCCNLQGSSDTSNLLNDCPDHSQNTQMDGYVVHSHVSPASISG